MKISDEGKRRIVFLVIICVVFLVILIGIDELLKRKLEIREKTQLDDTIYEKHIAMINEDPSEEFWRAIYKGAREEGEKLGIYIENLGEGLIDDYTTEELFEMAIASKVDGIILKADDNKTLAEMIEKATKENIPVMTILSDVKNSERISFVSGSDYAIGEMYGSQIAEEVWKKRSNTERKIKVSVLIDSNSKNETPNLIYSGIHQATASISDQLELSASVIDNSGMFESEEIVRNLLLETAPPDIIVCLSAVDTISTYQCVIDYNRVGQTSIIGYYSSADTLEGIQKGIIKSSVQIDAQELGKTAAQGMSKYLVKKYVSEYLTVKPTLIVKENVEDYVEDK